MGRSASGQISVTEIFKASAMAWRARSPWRIPRTAYEIAGCDNPEALAMDAESSPAMTIAARICLGFQPFDFCFVGGVFCFIGSHKEGSA